MARKELRHNRHTVPLLTDHKAITPKYRVKILVEKMIALAVEGIIRTTCKVLFVLILVFSVGTVSANGPDMDSKTHYYHLRIWTVMGAMIC